MNVLVSIFGYALAGLVVIIAGCLIVLMTKFQEGLRDRLVIEREQRAHAEEVSRDRQDRIESMTAEIKHVSHLLAQDGKSVASLTEKCASLERQLASAKTDGNYQMVQESRRSDREHFARVVELEREMEIVTQRADNYERGSRAQNVMIGKLETALAQWRPARLSGKPLDDNPAKVVDELHKELDEERKLRGKAVNESLRLAAELRNARDAWAKVEASLTAAALEVHTKLMAERDAFASAALVALAGAGVCTPVNGFVEGFPEGGGAGEMGACIKRLAQERDEARDALVLAEETIAGFRRVLDLIPPCPSHGAGCLTHAAEWILIAEERMRAPRPSCAGRDPPAPLPDTPVTFEDAFGVV